MKPARITFIIGVAMCVVGCGKVGDLEPRTGNTLPPQAYGQTIEQTAKVLTTPSVQARPGRTDELLKRSERREDDPFDVAPGEEPKPFDPEQTASPKKTPPK
ncbi:MAG: hypothetical protein ACK4ZE_10080 [Sphingorhabdus sp.]